LLVAALAVPLGLTLASGSSPVSGPVASASVPSPLVASAARRPNIVYVLLDDASLDLVDHMVNTSTMRRHGADFRNAFVSDSLCCPSRASILTGRYPHLTGVRGNVTGADRDRPVGGYRAFRVYGNESIAINVTLRRAGYSTGFVGKFMNGYEPSRNAAGEWDFAEVPGWDFFEAYDAHASAGWGFRRSYIAADGSFRSTDVSPVPPLTASVETRDQWYATNVMARSALSFIRDHERGPGPYFLVVAPHAPHVAYPPAYPGDPYFPPAFADRPTDGAGGNCGPDPCSTVGLDELAGWDDPRADNAPTYLDEAGATSAAPVWRTNPLETRMTAQVARRDLRNRVRMVQSVDRMIGQLQRAVGPDTYIVITSDNGYHLGQHQLNGGKGTPYDSDTRVPFIVVGPGVVPGPRSQVISNVDLAPTFERLAGLTPLSKRAGRSFDRILRDPGAPGAKVALFEHQHTFYGVGPDAERRRGGTTGLIPSWVAVRGPDGLVARFDLDLSDEGADLAWEAYDYRGTSFERTNVFADQVNRPWVREYMRRVQQILSCRARATDDAPACADLTR
jgi:arylsulfatase A-like enzyme